MEAAEIPFPSASLLANADTARRAIDEAVSNPIGRSVTRSQSFQNAFLGQTRPRLDTSKDMINPCAYGGPKLTFHGLSTILVTGARSRIKIVECRCTLSVLLAVYRLALDKGTPLPSEQLTIPRLRSLMIRTRITEFTTPIMKRNEPLTAEPIMPPTLLKPPTRL